MKPMRAVAAIPVIAATATLVHRPRRLDVSTLPSGEDADFVTLTAEVFNALSSLCGCRRRQEAPGLEDRLAARMQHEVGELLGKR